MATNRPDEPSGMIDMRALAAAAQTVQTSRAESRASEIANLGGGGAFAAPFLAPVEMEAPVAPRRNVRLIVFAGAAVLAMMLFASAAFAILRQKPTVVQPTVVVVTVTPSASTIVKETPSVSTPAIASATTPVPTQQRRIAPVATPKQSASVKAPTQPCCPGESDLACTMRVSVGGKCSS